MTINHLTDRPKFSMQRRRAVTGLWFMAPGLLVVLAVTIFPILYSIYMGFNTISLTTHGFHFHWNGLGNYRLLLSSSLFRYAIVFTLVYALVTVLVELVLGMMTALVLQRMAWGRPALLALLLLPWSLITVISAEMWGYIYNGVYGALDAILLEFGIIHKPIVWLGFAKLAIASTMFADVWKTMPFVAILLLAGLEMVPVDVIEAAHIDGASNWHVFWRIILPLIRPTMSLAILFRVLQAFGLFDLPFVLTGGGPGTATESIAVLGYQVMFQDLNFGPGAAVAASTTVVVLIIALAFLWVFRGMAEEGVA